MSTKTATNRFIVSSFKAYAGFYQQLAASALSTHELGNRLIRHAERARAFRQTERVRELGLMLANLPLKHFQTAGQYYLGWAMYRSKDSEQSRVSFEQLAASDAGIYQAHALLSLGRLEAAKQDLVSETQYYIEAFKASHDLYAKVEAVRGIAVIKAKEGFHESAVKDFERFLPFAARCDAATYNIYLNSLAVELGEVGRKEEARNIIKHVAASPFTHAYPEWQETARELKEPDHSFVTVPSIEYEPVEIEAGPKVVPIQPHQHIEPEAPAKVISFPELKEAPRPDQPKRVKRDELSEMTPNQKRELLLLGIKSGRIVEGEYNKLLFISGMVESGPAEQVIDLEDEALLKGIVMLWCNLIEPDQFAAVVSALRDCENDERRKAIMDDMITIAYEQTSSHTHSEREWRTKVECKLPNK